MDKRILDHLDHLDRLELVTEGTSSATVDCTKCGVVVHDFELEKLTEEEEMVRLRLIVSANSKDTTTFALVEMDQQLINELMEWMDRVIDLGDISTSLLRGSSINISILGDCPVTVYDYNKLSGNQHSWFHEIVEGDPPDDNWWVCVWSHDKETREKLQQWLDLINFPPLGGTTGISNATMFVTPLGFGWDVDSHGEKFYTTAIPWDLIKDHASS